MRMGRLWMYDGTAEIITIEDGVSIDGGGMAAINTTDGVNGT